MQRPWGRLVMTHLKAFPILKRLFSSSLSLILSHLLEGLKSIPILWMQKLRQGGSER